MPSGNEENKHQPKYREKLVCSTQINLAGTNPLHLEHGTDTAVIRRQ